MLIGQHCGSDEKTKKTDEGKENSIKWRKNKPEKNVYKLKRII